MKPGVLMVNFGGPATEDQLQPFLYRLLSDVLPGPSAVARWLAGPISRARAKRIAPAYRQIGFSPLVADTRAQLEAVRVALGDASPPMSMGMMFTPPDMVDGLRELLDQGIDHLVVLGLFPHWSFATSGSAFDMVHEALHAVGRPDLPVHYARPFFEDATYVDAVATTITERMATLPGQGPVTLLFSAHGLPVGFLKRGDPYPEHVRESARRVVHALGWADPWTLAWQSRLGPVRWIEPDTASTLARLGAEGVGRVLVVPLSFVGEHIETLYEIDVEYAEAAHEAGIEHIGRAAALGLQPAFIRCLSDLVGETLVRFGSYRCSRCLVPQPAEQHRRRSRCPSCAFVLPLHLREGHGGVA